MKKLIKISLVILILSLTASVYAGVMMQGFYWDVPAGGTWYNTMSSKAYGLRYMTGGKGINRMYFPSPSKSCDNAGYSMGYDIGDYYDVGQYNQYGSTQTRFGSQSELKAATAKYRGYGVSCMADIVLNHRAGTTSTSYASGKCTWSANKYHQYNSHSDPGVFGGYLDVCYAQGDYVGSPYRDIKDWLNWLKSTSNAGFNGGWRWDYVKGIYTWVIKDMRNKTGYMFCVGEYWDSNTSTLDWWVNATGSSAFDFASVYTLADICNNTGGGGYMPNLVSTTKSFAAKNPTRSVNFVGNHDTDPTYSDKMMAYAYIITYKGYPCIWYKDYFNYGLATLGGQWGNGIKQLVWVREKLGSGSPAIANLKTNDGDLLIYESNNYPGYIVAINDNKYNWRGSWVRSNNYRMKNKTLKCYAWYSSRSGNNYQPGSQWCDGNGWVNIWAPPRGYAVYAPNGY